MLHWSIAPGVGDAGWVQKVSSRNGRGPCYQGVIRHVMGDDGMGGYNAAPSDRHPGSTVARRPIQDPLPIFTEATLAGCPSMPWDDVSAISASYATATSSPISIR